jgi:hypothetical protein
MKYKCDRGPQTEEFYKAIPMVIGNMVIMEDLEINDDDVEMTEDSTQAGWEHSP